MCSAICCSCRALQAEEQARWEANREAEEGRLRRDRRVLEKQSKALLKLPNKKERSAMEGERAGSGRGAERKGGKRERERERERERGESSPRNTERGGAQRSHRGCSLWAVRVGVWG